jgi:threonine/homoserine/homoserine lactone efflux protein
MNGESPAQTMMLGLVVYGVIAYLSGSLDGWLRNKPGFNTLRFLTGVVLVGLSLRLALSDRRY